jgi:hypothetical protein
MLEMKDGGDDPNTLLYERLDEMLMKLERQRLERGGRYRGVGSNLGA